MIRPYYQEELEFLRELGREFARENPLLAPALAEPGSDPDVERVLQGVAFLTALIRQRLDDDLPEVTTALLDMLWPHYLRPVPSLCVVEFTHPRNPKITATQTLPRVTTELESVPVDGTPCRFRTCYDVQFHPLQLVEAELDPAGNGALRLKLKILGNAKPGALRLDPLRLYLHADFTASSLLYLWLVRHTQEVELLVPGPDRQRPRRHLLPTHPAPVVPVGFAEDEGLFPYPHRSFLGYRLLQEYFSLPQKFMFVDVRGIPNLESLGVQDGFELCIRFSERVPEELRVDTEHVRLHCTPAVNLRSMSADPISVTPERRSYLVRVADPEPAHFEVYSNENVLGFLQGRAERREYDSFYSFRHGLQDRAAIYYKLSRRRSGISPSHSDCHLSFVSADEKDALPEAETISVDLTCTNRDLCHGLRPGDVRVQTDSSPEFAEFQNLTVPTRSVLPPLEGPAHWGLISHLSLNLRSVEDVDGLRNALRLYNFHALHDRQAARALELRLGAMSGFNSVAEERMFNGAPLRGVHTTLELDEEAFSSEGEMYVFASVLEEFLALHVSLNTFSHLTVRGQRNRETYEWRPRLGRQIIL
jgi:type VI secretion system protein ImpG